ncbi:cyclodeaminase/cyclohydrolase family protein [Pseudomonadales bacterium]|nr:cyclodeaminase/cyclohydrolase family protein [Pseudomonadales bacterium]MDB3988311.1 cyclodeaminase/cyclohydrolase family protein [Pseudomonadales bacterium]
MIAKAEIGQYIENLGAKTSSPGGGAVAAVTGAQSIGLIEMVCQFTPENENETAIANIVQRTQTLAPKMLAHGDDDVVCFEALMASYKLPKSTTSEKSKRTQSIQVCLAAAATVPLNIIKIINGVIPDIQYLADYGNPNLITDVAIAASLGQSALTSSQLNVLINLKQIRDQTFRAQALGVLDSIPANLLLLQNIVDEITEQLN